MENKLAPKRLREVPQKRDLFSKHYLNEDGSYTAQISLGIAHYKDENNQYQDVSADLFDEDDFDLVDFPVTKDKKASFKAKREISEGLKEKDPKGKLSRDTSDFHGLKVPFDVTIPKNFKKGYSIGKGSDRLTFKPEGASNSKAERIGSNALKYTGVWDHTDVLLELQGKGLKETIILMDPTAPTTFTFEVTGPLKEDFTAGELKLEAAWLIDANGEKRDVQQNIRKQGAKTFLDVVADVYGLAYPIEIDPTITITETSNLGDAYVSTENGAANFDTASDLPIGIQSNGVIYKSFLKFDQSSIPAGAKISSAWLKLKFWGSASTTIQNIIRVYRPTTNWASNTITYNNQPGVVNDNNLYDTLYNPAGMTYSFDAKKTLQYHIDNGTNYGYSLQGDSAELNSAKYAYSDNVGVTTDRPSMEIVYNMPPSAPVVTAPNGGETIDKTFLITWSPATDTETTQPNLRYSIEKTLNGGTNWSTVAANLNPGITSYSYDFTAEAETTTAKIRVRAYDGEHYGPWDESNAFFTIKHNSPPGKPTATSVLGTSLAPAVVPTLSPTVSWAFNDPDAGNVQASRQFLVYNAAGVLMHDSGVSVSSANYYQVPGAILAWKTKYYWRVRTTDAGGLTSVYSDDQWFLTNQGPVGVITAPTATSGAGTIYNDTLQPTIAWTYSDADGDLQKSVQILIKDGATTVFDSGEIVTTGLSYQIPLAAGLIYDKTYTTQIRARDINDSWGVYSDLKYFHLNRSPGAPTGLNPAGTTGAPQVIQENLQPTLTWTFADADATDSQNAFQIMINDGGSGSIVHDSGWVTSAVGSYLVPAGILISGKKYHWNVKTKDTHLQIGTTAANQYFYTNAKPNTPTNPSPAGGSAASPVTVLDDLTPTLSWTFVDPNGTDVQKSFQVKLYNEAGSLLLDSGEVTTAAASYAIPQANKLIYSQIYQWEVRTKDQFDAWSNYTSRGWIMAKVGAPSGISATADNFGAKIIVDWNDSGAESLQGYNIYRATMWGGPYTKQNSTLLTESVYNDSNVTTGATYYYQVEAYVTDTEISPLSVKAAAVAVFSAWYIGDFKFIGPSSFGGKRNRIQSKRAVLGKTKRVIQDRGFSGEELQMEIFLGNDEYSTGKQKFDLLMAELEKTAALSVRDPFGQVWKVAPGGVDWNLVPGSGTLTYNVSVPLEEVN
jgi:hypothetical protein